MHRFPSAWDRALRISTALSAALLLAVGAGVAASVTASGAPAGLLALVLPLLALTLLLSWALAPRAFAVSQRALVVKRNLGRPVRIPLAEVRAVAALPDGALRGAWRIAGNAGMFGYYGRYRSRALGGFRLYATRSRGLVAVRTARDTFVLSPEPPGAFLEALVAAAPAIRPVEPGALPPAPARGTRAILASLGLGIPLLVAAIGVAIWALAPRAIAVEGDRIVVTRYLASSIEIPLSEVTALEPLPAAQLAGLRRVAGTAGFGVRYGRFWSPALGSFELYAHRDRGYVLIQATGRPPIVVTPDDPDRFVTDARAGLGR
jgi:hypothetical protein